jgi:predicted AlkP superfamily pyrophosphatase or phosphodiesterase
MTEIERAITERLLSHRLPGLDLGEDMVHPHYSGGSILNLPPSVCRWLGVPSFGQEALFPELLDAFGEGIQRVIFLMVDGLSLGRLQRWMESDRSSPWRELAREGVLAPLTSVTPSTTCTAMTSLWTGRSPAEHGIVGYELLLKEYGVVANMVLHKPMSFKDDTGSLSRAGFSPRAFLGLPTLGAHLKAHGVQPYAFHHHTIAHSGLSEMFLGDVEMRPYGTTTNLWISVRDLIDARPDERQFIWVYWSEVDHYSHTHGPDNERTQAEFRAFSQTCKELLLEPLSDRARQGSLLILAADHGQIATPKDPHYDLRQHPGSPAACT